MVCILIKINNTCSTKENGIATCIEGNPHDVIIWKEKLIIYLFSHFQVVMAKKSIQKIVNIGQINIAVNGEYSLPRFEVVIADKS